MKRICESNRVPGSCVDIRERIAYVLRSLPPADTSASSSPCLMVTSILSSRPIRKHRTMGTQSPSLPGSLPALDPSHLARAISTVRSLPLQQEHPLDSAISSPGTRRSASSPRHSEACCHPASPTSHTARPGICLLGSEVHFE